MSDSNTFVFAKITPKKEHFEQAKDELLGILEATRNEDGCIQFDLFMSDCGRYIHIFEEWQSKAALDNHHQEEHTQLVAQKFEHWLAAPTEVTLMEKL